MFRPSQAAFLRATLGLQKLHQQLPLNPHESQKLLKLLTTSFRKHLDAEHGPLLSKSDPAQPLKVKSKDNPIPHVSSQHIQSILTNPLFLPPASFPKPANGNDSMDVFDRAVAKGMMNIELATSCMIRKKDDIINEHGLNFKDAMIGSGTGRKVVNWLWSSGTQPHLEFFRNKKFTSFLMQFVVADGLQDVVWTWIDTNFQRHLTSFQSTHTDIYRDPILKTAYFVDQICGPLAYLVKSEAFFGKTLDSAYLCLHHAENSLSKFQEPLKRAVMRKATGLLLAATINNSASRSPPAEANFDKFLSIVAKSNLTPLGLIRAHLHLLHPTRPTIEPALQILIDSSPAQSQQTSASIRTERCTILLGLDATKYLLEHERFSEADTIMEFLRSNFAAQLGEQRKKTPEDASAEAASLEMLGFIGVAA